MFQSRTLKIVRIALLAVMLLAGLVTQAATATGTGAVVVDRTWLDENQDGIQDIVELDLPEVTVNLYACDGTPLASGITNVSGNVRFDVLPGYFYFVEFIAPGGYAFSPKDQGTDDDHDSDADPLTGRTECFTVVAGALEKRYDAGFYEKPVEPAALGDFVWEDQNKDGIQDAGEPGVPGVKVELYDCLSNALVSTQTTDADGKYLFPGLVPGSYYVKFYTPAGYTITAQNSGDDASDSDADASGVTACVDLEAGETDLTVDAGIYKPVIVTNSGTGTPGYWKNHPEAWPVDSITIGGVTYSKDEAIFWMSQDDKHDKRITMFRSLVAATLNVLIGNDSSCIADTITAAEAWMAAYGPMDPEIGLIRASSDAWKVGEPLYSMLDSYNNGFLCALARD